MARRIPDLTGPQRGLESAQIIGTLQIFPAQIRWVLFVLGMFAGTVQARDTQIPWAAVAEVLQSENACDEGRETAETERQWLFAHAVESKGRASDYAVKPRQRMVAKPPQGTRVFDRGRKKRAELLQWQDGVWRPGSRITLRTRDRQPRLLDGIADTGFYKVCLPAVTSPVCHAIVCDNWKKDLLAFCRHSKQQIELNLDAELIRSSLAISHWDHVMGLASESRALTGGILEALRRAVEGMRAFEAGRSPDVVSGLNKLRLRRFQGAPVEEFVVFIPDPCRGSRAWPLFVHCDRARFGAMSRYRGRTGYIDLWWHTVSDKEVDWRSYQTLLQMLRRCVNVDSDRIYVAGECLNSLAAVSLALNYPDHWAECWIELGNTYRYLAGNALNLPFVLVKGAHEEAEYVAYFDFAAKCFQYHGCRHFQSSRDRTPAQVCGTPVPQAVRERSPRRVSYTVESLRNPTAYWVTIAGREDENRLATVDACIDGQTIRVATDNVDAYTLNLALAPVDTNEPVRIVENGRPLDPVTGPAFTRRSEKYRDAERVKTSRLCGPLSDVFTDAYVVAWGSGGDDRRLVAATEEAAWSLSGQGPCFADVNLPEHLLSAHNLVLVGTPESNRWLARIDPCMPARIAADRIAAGSREYKGPDLGYMLIYPNPLNVERYAAVFSATSARAMACLPDAYSRMKSIRPADVGIFEVADDGGIKWHVLERFNTVWTWHEKYDRPIMTVKREHPAWQWQQWLARTLRRRLQAHVVVYEEPYLFASPPPVGEWTYRDVFNTFKNYWISKVEMDGADLRGIAEAPLGDGPGTLGSKQLIDGVSVIRMTDRHGDTSLAISDLRDGRTYTAAMSEKCLKGELGFIPEKYKIVDQMYVIPMLTALLEADAERDIDAELDQFTFRMF